MLLLCSSTAFAQDEGSVEEEADIYIGPEHESAVEYRQSGEAARGPASTGPTVSYKNYPWQVGLRMIDRVGNASSCGGFLISRRHILTAAHCVNQTSKVGQRNPYPIERIFAFRSSDQFATNSDGMTLDSSSEPNIHWDYELEGIRLHYDAAVLRLQTPLTDLQPLAISGSSHTRGRAHVSGWGENPDSDEALLRAVDVAIASRSSCLEVGDSAADRMLTNETICTLERDAEVCGGDSGGPMVTDFPSSPRAIGIVSWAADETCGKTFYESELLNGYTRISSILTWLTKATGDEVTILKN